MAGSAARYLPAAFPPEAVQSSPLHIETQFKSFCQAGLGQIALFLLLTEVQSGFPRQTLHGQFALDPRGTPLDHKL